MVLEDITKYAKSAAFMTLGGALLYAGNALPSKMKTAAYTAGGTSMAYGLYDAYKQSAPKQPGDPGYVGPAIKPGEIDEEGKIIEIFPIITEPENESSHNLFYRWHMFEADYFNPSYTNPVDLYVQGGIILGNDIKDFGTRRVTIKPRKTYRYVIWMEAGDEHKDLHYANASYIAYAQAFNAPTVETSTWTEMAPGPHWFYTYYDIPII